MTGTRVAYGHDGYSAPSKRRGGRVSLGSSVVRDRPACFECVDIKFVISVDCEINVRCYCRILQGSCQRLC